MPGSLPVGCRLKLTLAVTVMLCAAVWGRADWLVGDLKVTTTPEGATVYVAGRDIGPSPCELRDVGIGIVEVAAEMEGYARAAKIVKLRGGETVEVEFVLERLVNVGHLVVNVEPDGADVEVDRVLRGETPLRVINLEAGTHRLRVAHEGYVPMITNVVIVKGKDRVVRGRLTKGILGPEGAGAPVAPEEIVDPAPSLDEAPELADMPEAQAFEPVRKLLAGRRYEDAMAALREMAADQDSRRYMARIARDRLYARKALAVVQAGYKALEKQVGRNYHLQLSGGIAADGKVLAIGDGYMVFDFDGSGEGQQIALERLHIDRVARLAAHSFAPDDPANQAFFAVMNAMEGSFKEAYQALRRAAEAGYDVSQARDYVDSERLWQAAREKHRRDEARAKAEQRARDKAERASGNGDDAPVTGLVLVDRHRGGYVEYRIRVALEEAGFEIEELVDAPTQVRLKEAAVLLIIDPGPERFVLPYDQAAARLIAGFVKSGGGLLFVGASRLRRMYRRYQPVASPFSPMLKQFRLDVRPDWLESAVNRKGENALDYVTARPAQRHPALKGIDSVAFPFRSGTVVGPKGGRMLAASPSISSRAGTRPPLLLGACATLGKGRVIALGSIPHTEFEDQRGRRPGQRLLVNAVRWLALPKARAASDDE